MPRRAPGCARRSSCRIGNSREKNAAMRALGADLVEHGHDFQEALEFAQRMAVERGLHMVPSFDPALVRGVATYALEFFGAVADLDTVYVPIGLGSGICGMIAAREALGLRTKIVGVVAENAPAYALSFAAGRVVTTESADTIADGVACRVPLRRSARSDQSMGRADRDGERGGNRGRDALLLQRYAQRGRRRGRCAAGGAAQGADRDGAAAGRAGAERRQRRPRRLRARAGGGMMFAAADLRRRPRADSVAIVTQET